ncbi:putative AAA+ superfamily ATPase [Gluconobacter cerinus]|nr:putative AAA+ superfamily ATPase [Gluconobacter cerinus]
MKATPVEEWLSFFSERFGMCLGFASITTKNSLQIRHAALVSSFSVRGVLMND